MYFQSTRIGYLASKENLFSIHLQKKTLDVIARKGTNFEKKVKTRESDATAYNG